ncbi:MAG TPA: hypothetical protein VNT52_13285 [Acidimicrobiales bacterium]|nr:hypothetical protein [Acidimicrobiales bacterium]
MVDTPVVRVTYREIAERFGIGIEGARLKAKRRAAKGLWRIIPGNHPQDVVRVEMPEAEFAEGQDAPRRGAAHEPNEGTPTTPPQQGDQGRDTNDLVALVDVISQLSAQALAMTERLIAAERAKAIAEGETAIARAALEAIEARMRVLESENAASLETLRGRLEADAERARAELAAWRARPWWRRLAR